MSYYTFNIKIMKKTVKLISNAALLVLMLSLTGCYYDEVIEPAPLPPDFEATFANDIQPIFTANCISCHGGSQEPDLRAGSAYAEIVNGEFIVPNDIEASVLYQRLVGNGALMPPGNSLSTTKINLVKNWIENGALNN